MVIRTRLCVRVHITMLTGNEGMGPTSCCCLLLLQAQQLGPTTTTATTMLRETANLTRPAVCVCVCVVETGLGRRLDGPPTLPKHKLRLPIMSMLPTAHSLQNSQTSCLLFKNKNRFCTSPEKTIHYFNNRRVKQRNGQIRLKLFKMKKRDVSRVPRRGTSSK